MNNNVSLQSLINRYVFTAIFSIAFLFAFTYLTITYHIHSSDQIKEHDISTMIFNAKRRLSINQIQSTFKQISSSSLFKRFLQSSDITRKAIKYEVLAFIGSHLLENPQIAGTVVMDTNGKEILKYGSITDASVQFELNYTNNTVDNYGVNLGSAIFYLDESVVIKTLSDPRYQLYTTNKHEGAHEALIHLYGDENYISILGNSSVWLSSNYQFDSRLLWYLLVGALSLLLFILIGIIAAKKITKPIDTLHRTIFSDYNHDTSKDFLEVDELFWIDRIIRMYHAIHEMNRQRITHQANQLGYHLIRKMHYLKSKLCSLKLLASTHETSNSSSQSILAVSNEVVNQLNETLISAKQICDDVSSYRITYCNIESLVDVLAELKASFSDIEIDCSCNELVPSFLPVSDEQLFDMFHNMLTNAMQAGATIVNISCYQTGDVLSISCKDNGGGVNLADATKFLYGHSTKTQGSGIGLSESRRLLESSKSSIRFKPAVSPFTTDIEMHINTIPISLSDCLNAMLSHRDIAELIVATSDTKTRKTLSNLNLNHYITITYINEDELSEYMKLSVKSGLSKYQCYLLSSSLDINNFKRKIAFLGGLITLTTESVNALF